MKKQCWVSRYQAQDMVSSRTEPLSRAVSLSLPARAKQPTTCAVLSHAVQEPPPSRGLQQAKNSEEKPRQDHTNTQKKARHALETQLVGLETQVC